MSFESDIFDLEPILLERGFQLLVHAQNFARYGKGNIILELARDPRNRFFTLNWGLSGSSLEEITPLSIVEFFGDPLYDKKMYFTIEDLIGFFRGSGSGILTGNEDLVKSFKSYKLQTYEEFQIKWNRELVQNNASRAWAEKDYVRFIDCMNRLDRSNLTDTELKRLKIALDKVGHRGENQP
jgi:hypothetical protein